MSNYKPPTAERMSNVIEVKVPDIGDFKDIPVIEVLVKPGDSVKAEDPLITLESDKATMEVPSPQSGVVKEIKVKVGDKVSRGHARADARCGGVARPQPQPPPATQPAARRSPPPAPSRAASCSSASRAAAAPPRCAGSAASPHRVARADRRSQLRSSRMRARRCGVSRASSASICRKVTGSGPKEPHPARRRAGLREGANSRARAARRRRARIQSAADAAGRFREVRAGANAAAVAHQEAVGRQPASQLGQRFRTSRSTTKPTSPSSRNSASRRRRKRRKQGIRFTLLAFLMKAVVVALKQYPELQFVAVARRRESDPEAVLPYRRGGRYAERAGRAGDPRRRQERPARARARARRSQRAHARRQDQSRRSAGRLLLDLEPRRTRRHASSRPSSMRRKSRYSASASRS